MSFLESPAGVGFSKTNNKSDYHTGDWRTTEDAFLFLLGFFQRYPQFQKTPFWITGESYGGHYVPLLAKRILDGNKNGESNINIQGFMVGNAWTSMPIDNLGAVTYWWTHALISDETFTGIVNNCNFSDVGPLTRERDDQTCNEMLSEASQEMGNINIYDIYVDVCLSSRTKKILKQMSDMGSYFHQVLLKSNINPPYQPCADEYTQTYLNRADVQKALHASISYKWSECSGLVRYNYSDVQASVLPLYDEFLSSQLQILVYSGDVDAIVPVYGTRQWLHDLNRPIISPWRPWISSDQQVGGYVTSYKGLTFATIRNAGHMVPQTQPQRALDFFSRFLSGNPL